MTSDRFWNHHALVRPVSVSSGIRDSSPFPRAMRLVLSDIHDGRADAVSPLELPAPMNDDDDDEGLQVHDLLEGSQRPECRRGE